MGEVLDVCDDHEALVVYGDAPAEWAPGGIDYAAAVGAGAMEAVVEGRAAGGVVCGAQDAGGRYVYVTHLGPMAAEVSVGAAVDAYRTLRDSGGGSAAAPPQSPMAMWGLFSRWGRRWTRWRFYQSR